MPISFSHAAHACQVKQDFLESASNSANFFSRQSKIHCSSLGEWYFLAMGVLLTWDSECHDHKPELTLS